MSATGVPHAMAISRATRLFSRVVEDKAEVRIQLPLPLSRFSEFEPDLCLVDFNRGGMESRHPVLSNVFLVMEIADSSLRYDRDIKLPIYAAAGVAEVWIADLSGRTLHVYRRPSRRNYTVVRGFGERDSVSPLAFPEITIAVSDIVMPSKT